MPNTNTMDDDHRAVLLIRDDEDDKVFGGTVVGTSSRTSADVLNELVEQSSITVPLALTLLCRFIQGFVDLAVVGRLVGSEALAGASLALTIQFTTTGIVTMGFGDAVAALSSQALGAQQPSLCGRWLQLGMLASTGAICALAPLYWLTGDLLIALGVDSATAGFASLYARIALPRAFIHVNYYSFKVYLAAQKRLKPDVVGCVVGLCVSVVLDFLLVGGTCTLSPTTLPDGQCWGGLGFIGAPIAAVASRAITAGLVLGLAQLKVFGAPQTVPKSSEASDDALDPATGSDVEAVDGRHRAWTGWALHAGADGALRQDRVRSYLAVALPAAGRSLVDQGQIAALALMAGALSPAAAAAHNSLIELYACVGGAVCWANCDAVIVRVGRAMGSGDPASARRAAVVGVSISVAFAVLIPPLVLLPAGAAVGRLFTDDPEVISITATTLPAMCGLIVATALVFSLLGAAIGTGQAAAGGRAWLIGCAAIVPMAWGWGVASGGGVPALWGSCCVGYAITAGVLFMLLVRLDWDNIARDVASKRAQDSAAELEAQPIPATANDGAG